MRVMVVAGTRPEAIKLAPVISALTQRAGRESVCVCSTGQHRQMLDSAFAPFGVRPDVDLNAMTANQGLAALTARLMEGLDRVVSQVSPDWILAQGDTTSAMTAGLVAHYRRVKFGHVEAGLRTGDKWRPFPEEVNRRIADLVADAYFAPTELARDNLLREGCPPARILVTGNTVVDALLTVASLPFDWAPGPLAAVPRSKRLVLVTAHRRESFGEPFREICLSIRELAEAFAPDVHFVYPVHLNPNVCGPVNEILGCVPNVSLIGPVDYLTMVNLMKAAEIVMTDSGGIQEEAPTLGVPVLVMRDTTERPEGVDMGVARLVGTSRQRIVSEARRLLEDSAERRRMSRQRNPYGDGKAAARIAARVLETS